MSKAEDINTLFRRFGGNAETYQEIVAGELAGVAEQKWPMLGQLRPQAHREAPSARKGAAAVGDRQVHAFMDPPRYAVAPPAEPAAVAPMAKSSVLGVSDQLPVDLPAVAPVPTQANVPVSSPVAGASFLGAVGAPSQFGPAAAQVAVAANRPSLPTSFGRAAAVPAEHVEAVSPSLGMHSTSVSAVSPVAGALPAAPLISEQGASDLQTMFNRLLPPKVVVPAELPAPPLKRLVKW